MKSRSIRTLSVLASAGLIVGAFAVGPADAAKKKKKPPVCTPYVGHEKAADAKLVTVTDAATADAPVEVEVETDAGLGLGRPGSNINGIPVGDHVSEAFVNLQVDSAVPAAGLYVSIEFSEGWDYDLYLDNSAGDEVAHAAGTNLEEAESGEGAQTETTTTTETILGLETADCGGYSADVVGSVTAGETVTVKAWLGEIQAAPAE